MDAVPPHPGGYRAGRAVVAAVPAVTPLAVPVTGRVSPALGVRARHPVQLPHRAPREVRALRCPWCAGTSPRARTSPTASAAAPPAARSGRPTPSATSHRTLTLPTGKATTTLTSRSSRSSATNHSSLSRLRGAPPVHLHVRRLGLRRADWRGNVLVEHASVHSREGTVTPAPLLFRHDGSVLMSPCRHWIKVSTLHTHTRPRTSGTAATRTGLVLPPRGPTDPLPVAALPSHTGC